MTQTLKLADDLFESLNDGTKKDTIRLGHRNIVPGLLVFEGTTNHNLRKEVTVTKVNYYIAGEVSTARAKNLGYLDQAHMIYCLRRFYYELDEDSEITVIWFE